MNELIQEIATLNPVVQVALVIALGTFASVAVWSLFKTLRTIITGDE